MDIRLSDKDNLVAVLPLEKVVPKESAPILNPPISPEIEYKDPSFSTLKGASPAVASPIHNLYVPSVEDNLATSSPVPTVMLPSFAKVTLPPVNEEVPNVHPPTVPLCAVNTPAAVTLKGALL